MRRLEQDPCRCLIAPGPSAVFRLGLNVADAAAVDSLGRPLAGLDSLVAQAVRRQADSLAHLGWRYSFQATPTGRGSEFVFFTERTDSLTGRRYVYGFAVPAAHMVERVFRPAFQSLRVIPRHLLGVVSRNDEFVSLELETPEGQVFYSTTPTYPEGPTDALNLPTLRGGLTVRAHLNPRIKDALIPGGIPPKIPFREIALIGLSLALLLAIAAFGLRVGALARLRSDLASSVTHELRTPLTQIRLAAETVLFGRSRNPESERRSLASIVDEAKRLQQLIDNVLHFSQAERQLTRVRMEPLELRGLVERAVGDLAPLVAGRGIELRVEIPENLVVQGDANALRQIVLNLLDNAARYGPERQTVTVGAEPRDGQVELWVQDRGPGVPGGRPQAGVGGVRAVGARSRVGGDRYRAGARGGARAGRSAGWPLLDRWDFRRRAGRPGRGAPGWGRRRGMSKVLVVEDHGAIAQGLQENLELEGFEVRVSTDGIDATRVAATWMPDLILLDLMLPKRSGWEVLTAIRARRADTLVMVVSARGSEAEKVRALRAGADDYVVKPFGLLEVLARVHALLRRASGERGGAPSEHYRLGEIAIDVPTRSVNRGGEPVVLRPKEFDLLVALCRARGAVVSRGDLLNRVWGYGPSVVTRTVDTHVAALRQRLEEDAEDPKLILTVWKAGYRVAGLGHFAGS